MSEFTFENWLQALVNLKEKAAVDSTYRSLCISNPVAAIRAVSDIDIPDDLKVQFFGDPKEYLYTYLLPPLLDERSGDAVANALIGWETRCTIFPTTAQ